MKHLVTLIIAALAAAALGIAGIGSPASAAASQPTTAPSEPDTRLPPGRPGGWGFKPAAHPNPALPSVLLIGDSVCNGYRDMVAADLAGKANVDAWVNPLNQASGDLLAQTQAALKQGGPYAVIHFNMGLHGWAKGRIPPGQYTPLTIRWIKEIQADSPGAKLIWASTTPVTTKGEKGQPLTLDPDINPIIVDQNAQAAKIMADQEIPVDDLYTLVAPKLDLARGDQFHWTPPGYKLMAKQAAKMIGDDLAK